jgi:hypothetical protein
MEKKEKWKSNKGIMAMHKLRYVSDVLIRGVEIFHLAGERIRFDP